MKQLVAALILLFLLPLSTHAAGNATFSLSPSTMTVTEGETFAVDVMVNPGGEQLDTVRLYLNFPADVLQVNDIALHTLFPRQSPGNSIDNEAGSISYGAFNLDQTVTAPGLFATITFAAKQNGQATLDILDTSRLISAGEEKANPDGHTDASVTVSKSTDQTAATNVTIQSQTHPNEADWYNKNDVAFAWTVSDDARIKNYFLAFDSEPDTQPTETASVETLSKNYADVADGIRFFHVKAATDAGESETAHFAVHIDMTPPNTIAPYTPRIRYNEGDSALLEFGTTDDLSGIDHYEVAVNDGPFTVQESPLVIKGLVVGDLLIEVKAIDRAGNARFGKNGIRVYPADVALKDEDIAARAQELERIEALGESTPPKNADKKFDARLLITFLLAIVLFAGIITAIRKRRRKI